ncbi:hypothetical protein [Flexivirga oryzae]|uniref:Uncharacterized protein n=1 Tax=Flexivirga oryzae TaxID=1794944 RepID=A0A839N374_9MICO|nr:hypothetical protein [Flexivirga oryzae]MBB2892188.1 hypothetical protein [Flexivirga oryzae]
MKRFGRFRCGRDDRVLLDLIPRSIPRDAERRAYDASSHDPMHHLEFADKNAPRLPGSIEYRDDGNVLRGWRILVCKCGIRYAIDSRDIWPRALAAARRGEDVTLTEADRDRSVS